MIPAPFDYVRAASVADAVRRLGDLGEDAKVLAGGHSLLPLMKLRLAMPSTLIDIGRLPELDYIRTEGDEVVIGALTRHATVESDPLLAKVAPLVAHVASRVGDPQVRHRGTIGGSLMHADPAADLPAAILATGGVAVLVGPAGRRQVDFEEFFRGFFETAAQATEILVEIRLPQLAGRPWGYEKFTRRANDWAIVAAAAVDGRVALANVAGTPVRARATEQALARGLGAAEAAHLAAEGLEPSADMHASSDYRRHLARLLTRRALQPAA